MPADPEVSFASAALAPRNIANRALGGPAPPAPGNAQSPDVRGKAAHHKLSFWIYASAAVAAIAIAGGVFLWLYSSGGKGAGNAETTVTLETFVVNLDGSEQRAYLRVGITLGLAHPLTRNSKEDLPSAALRDAILSVLSTARADQLLTTHGKEELKADLLRVITERLPQVGVQNVYFTEFLVQM